ncbi:MULTISPECIES: DUF6262 family protein [unclassified Krasilnikovia]|uniref:DUF6262 family protein n=1 Tax=unclassified Krasilnikovia TaxID=2622557 RepID=UPI00382CC794
MPPADNTHALREAGHRRTARARRQAEAAICHAQHAGQPATVAGIARAAGVSRSWLYTQTDLIAAITSLRRHTTQTARTTPHPASEASLRRRLDTALHRIKQLREANADLTKRLEIAHGHIRDLRCTQTPGNRP